MIIDSSSLRELADRIHPCLRLGEDNYIEDFCLDAILNLRSDLVCECIMQALERGKYFNQTDRIGLISRAGGALGIVPYAHSLLKRLDREVCVYRYAPRLATITYHGDAIKKGERILIISDKATEGLDFLSIAEFICSAGGYVKPFVLALVDLQQGARELLSQYDITFQSVFTRDSLSQHYNLPYRTEQIPLLHLQGRSVTK